LTVELKKEKKIPAKTLSSAGRETQRRQRELETRLRRWAEEKQTAQIDKQRYPWDESDGEKKKISRNGKRNGSVGWKKPGS